MKPIVVVENVSKKYSRNAQTHLSYGVADLFKEILGGKKKELELRKDEFRAVDDVSFHLNPSESFALIGRNGSGKTTLLKMMNGLTKPDAGTIIMDGRVQALINLGAGFNVALSGRENIYNSAALMGLGRRQTSEIVDEIVEFAELEEFIDGPVQTYSRGMQARLGFSVAVHLQPDILLIDEILSVGDMAFQNKCFIRLQQLKKRGVTFILVSHSPTHVVQLCERALWLHKGSVMAIGPAKQVTKSYLKFLEQEEVRQVQRYQQSQEEGTKEAKRESWKDIYGPIFDEFDKIEDLEVNFLINGREDDVLRVHDDLLIRYRFRLKVDVKDLNISLNFYRKDGMHLTTVSTLNGDLVKHIHQGVVSCELHIPDFNFNPGNYVLVMPIHEGKSYLYRDVVKNFVATGNGVLTWGLTDLRYEYRVDRSA